MAGMPQSALARTRAHSAPPAHGLAALERRTRGRLGVATMDLATSHLSGHRTSERFPLCSTFKLLAAAFVLRRVDLGLEQLDRSVSVHAAELVTGSPVTESRRGQTMSVGELCAAAMTRSDNTAGNLLLGSFGGPAALTAFTRELGDPITRVDRMEPALNDFTAGELRDTTSPQAMVHNLRNLVAGDILTSSSRVQLRRWLTLNRTGDRRLRAGLPPEWVVGDKTGSSSRAANDVAVAWPVNRPPILIAAYLDAPAIPAAERDVVLAEVGAIVARTALHTRGWPRS